MERGGEGHDCSSEKNLAGPKMSAGGEREINACGEEHADEGEQICRSNDTALLFRRRTMLDERVKRHSVEAAEKSEQREIHAHGPDAEAVPRN